VITRGNGSDDDDDAKSVNPKFVEQRLVDFFRKDVDVGELDQVVGSDFVGFVFSSCLEEEMVGHDGMESQGQEEGLFKALGCRFCFPEG
jgi:hypothetical protein